MRRPRPRRRLARRLVTISTRGSRPTSSATRTKAARDPVSAQCQSSTSTTSGATARQGGDQRRQRVEQRRLQMFAAEVARKHVDIARHGQQVQEERQERLERRRRSHESVRPPSPRSASGGAEIERRAQNLHEDAVGHAVAVGSASRLQHAHARGAVRGVPAARTSSRLFPAPGSPTTATTAPSTARGARDVRLEHRQLGLTADVRRQPGSARRLQPRRDPGLAEHAERRQPVRPANRARPAGTPPCACRARRDAASQG